MERGKKRRKQSHKGVFCNLSFSNTANIGIITSLPLCPNLPLCLPHLLLQLRPSSSLTQVTLFILVKLFLLLHKLRLSSIFHTTRIASTKMLIISFSSLNFSLDFCTTGHVSSLSLSLSPKLIRISTKNALLHSEVFIISHYITRFFLEIFIESFRSFLSIFFKVFSKFLSQYFYLQTHYELLYQQTLSSLHLLSPTLSLT